MNQNQILDIWKNAGILIKFETCQLCQVKNYCQHQGFCISCMAIHNKITQQIKQKLKNKCGMCGKSNIIGICGKCQRGSF